MRVPGLAHRSVAALALLVLALAVPALVFVSRRMTSGPGAAGGSPSALTRELAAEWTALENREDQADATVWAKEKVAEQCSLVFDRFWDTLNRVTNKLEVLGLFSFGELIPSQFKPASGAPHGIFVRESAGGGPAWNPAQWRQFLGARQQEGWQLNQCEFRHNRFEVDANGQPKQSVFYVSAHLANTRLSDRAILEGDLVVDWNSPRGPDGLPTIQRLDSSRLVVRTRNGEPAFQPLLLESVAPLPTSYFIDPLILYDLDGDGFSEIILAAKNLVFRRRSDGRFVSEPLCRYPPGLIFTGLIADFDGDGAADFLCAKFEGLYFYKGSARGTFDQPGRLVWSIQPHLKYAQAFTCGDIDRDGDLDVWLGQYKVPYERGQMPTPYFDANDGNPAYLLLNDGQANFSDATETSGLGEKRRRRTYSGSFVDLDGDGNLDLVVVSDFAGLDLYRNNGRGHFSDVTKSWVTEAHAFGMAHALADFNADSRLDLLMIGMNSPTADRLIHLGLERPGYTQFQPMRPLMTFGNRLYLANSGERSFQQTALNDSVARSGWSWGCSAADFDNDGFPDVYIANGHTSGQSVREYEPQFWTHDIYIGSSSDSIVANAYFGSKFSKTRAKELSYGGYEKNRLYLNQRGAAFIEAAHLFGVAMEEDSRNAVADDLDGDGRLDLLVTTFEVWPETKQTLRIFKNTLNDTGHWIGVRLREEGGGVSPVGARVTLRHSFGVMTAPIVAGDSFRSQQANTVHFGLGDVDRVESVEIRWLNGRTRVLEKPAVDQYYDVRLADPGTPSRAPSR